VGQTVVNTLPGKDKPLGKNELLNGLNIFLNNFLYGCVCPNLVPPELWNAASQQTAVFKSRKGDVEIKLGPLVKRARNADYTAAEGFKRNYENSLLRTMMREAHELILLYCRETGQIKAYKAQPWFQFARVLRNVMSHEKGGTLREWPSDLLREGITSVTWREKTFDTTMLGQRVVFYPPEGLELLKDQMDFVREKLS
jgi:hypothetical protein